jgi:hypothetical protein
MRFSPAKHFWVWFARNSETILQMHLQNKNEFTYWVKEIGAHLRACGRGILFEIAWGKNGATPRFILTSNGRKRCFQRIENLVSKTPAIPGWEIIAFQPPQPIDFFIEEEFGHTGIDPYNLWFEPLGPGDKPVIRVYAERYEPIGWEFEQAAGAVVYNLLGERSATLDIGGVEVERILELPAGKRSRLIKLEELPARLERFKVSSFRINDMGILEEGKG